MSMKSARSQVSPVIMEKGYIIVQLAATLALPRPHKAGFWSCDSSHTQILGLVPRQGSLTEVKGPLLCCKLYGVEDCFYPCTQAN